MKYLQLLLPLFFSVCWNGPLRAQTDSAAAIMTVLPMRSSGSEPVFSPFCQDIVWLGNLAYSLPEKRFLPVDSMVACLPTSAVHLIAGSNPAYPYYIWWQIDPYSERYYWAGESWSDSLFLWRYDRLEKQQKRFIAQAQGYYYLIGKAGIWVSRNKELVLLDRDSGRELKRVAQAEELSGLIMDLRNWGDHILVSERMIFKMNPDQFIPFFPLPADMQGCRSPDNNIQFYKEVCGARVQRNEDNKHDYYLSTPNHAPVRVPLPLSSNYVWMDRQILASNPPLTWFYFPDRLIAFNIHTGDSLVYPGATGTAMPGNQDGRFLGFHSEKGLSFFDKEQCQFRVLDLPYEYQPPHHFTSYQGRIFLTYENRWEIIDFSKLNLVFKPALIQEEYQVFEKEYSQLYTGQTEEFTVAYEKYLKLYNRYRHSQNPKIADKWDYAKAGLSMALFSAPDSVLAMIAQGYYAGQYDPSISCELAQTIFNYHGYRGEIQEALHLLQINDNATCITDKSQDGQYCIDLLKTAQFRLDSVQKVKQPKDQHLYALGKVWWDYCFNKRNFRYSYNPRGDFGQAYDYYRQLLHKYPKSPWADNAAYDTMYYIDYHSTTTDDETPDGNDEQAHAVFTQFLQDYPHSDRRPDVLLRLAGIVQRGLYGPYNNASGQAQLAAYLESIAQDNPDFAKSSEEYQKLAFFLQTQIWASRWLLQVSTDREVYKLSDTIRVTIQFYNQSKVPQSLDTTFLNHWQDRLFFHLYQQKMVGCEDRSGDFPLLQENPLLHQQAITVAPGSSYGETFVLAHTSQVRSYGSKIFDLASGGSYSHYMEYRHPVWSWLRLQAVTGGSFKVE